MPVGPQLQYTSEKPADPITLTVYTGANGDFRLYEDDGATYGYERGAFSRIPIRWDDATKTLTIGARMGTFTGMLATRTFRVVLVSAAKQRGLLGPSPGEVEATLTYDGRAVVRRFP